MRFANDTRLLVCRGMVGATGNLYVGLQEFEEMAFMLHQLRPDDVFVDVGANVGAYTLLAGTAGARCVAFEPVPATFRALRDNVRLNGLQTRVRVVRSGSLTGRSWGRRWRWLAVSCRSGDRASAERLWPSAAVAFGLAGSGLKSGGRAQELSSSNLPMI
jgi:hypothetical protein